MSKESLITVSAVLNKFFNFIPFIYFIFFVCSFFERNGEYICTSSLPTVIPWRVTWLNYLSTPSWQDALMHILSLFFLTRCERIVRMPPTCMMIQDPANQCCQKPYCLPWPPVVPTAAPGAVPTGPSVSPGATPTAKPGATPSPTGWFLPAFTCPLTLSLSLGCHMRSVARHTMCSVFAVCVWVSNANFLHKFEPLVRSEAKLSSKD